MSNEPESLETPKQKRLYKKYLKLRKLADKAMNARYEFEHAFNRARSVNNQKEWKEMCDLMGIVPDATEGDWMC